MSLRSNLLYQHALNAVTLLGDEPLFFQLGFERDALSGARLYLPGLAWARTGKPLLFFEVSFEDYLQGR